MFIRASSGIVLKK